ncbi:MAG: CPBP family intramembrane metalloprotease [Bacteroidales bacterium]|nr:CPBP family intramembrane metalloprotease [Bacteroidales bacterium]MCF8333561.1 CPBP family intramembrane metalloprotease [Bacteroidales bacterium]
MTKPTNTTEYPYFNKLWRSNLRFNWVFGLVLVILLGIPRFIIVMRANVTGNYAYLSILFLLMWFLPLLFLSKQGRRFAGIRRVQNWLWLVYSFLIGAGISTLVFLAGMWLFGETVSNWFVYIGRAWSDAAGMSESQLLVYFIIAAVISMTFSPVGEELFYRGVVHASFQVSVGDNNASHIDSLAFALTHLAHFGIVFDSGSWRFLLLPALLWVGFMYLTSRAFYMCKKKSGSITGAILSHAGFNLAMMYFIFYHIQ